MTLQAQESSTWAAEIRVGGALVPWTAAKAWASRYLNSPSEHWAYPAYDSYPGGRSDTLSEPDLLAPILLNVRHISLRTYDALVEALPDLNSKLTAIPKEAALGTASAMDLSRITDLLGLLDDLPLPGVQLTTLSKILHRIRPRMIPLYDEHIRRCYQELGHRPIPGERGRTWREFAELWLPAVQTDLATQLSSWKELAALAPGPSIAPLRALDIVGWFAGNPNRSKREG